MLALWKVLTLIHWLADLAMWCAKGGEQPSRMAIRPKPDKPEHQKCCWLLSYLKWWAVSEGKGRGGGKPEGRPDFYFFHLATWLTQGQFSDGIMSLE